MKKINCWKWAAAIFMISFVLIGCGIRTVGEKTEEPDVPVSEVELSVGAANIEDMSAISDFDKSAGNQDKNLQKAAELNTNLFDGSDMELWYGGEEQLIVLKNNKLYLYDVAGGEIIAEGETECWHLMDVYPYNDGFCIIGSLGENIPDKEHENEEPYFEIIESPDDTPYLAVFCDNSLQETNRILLNDIMECPDANVWAVSPDASILAYFNIWDGLCVYECSTKTQRQLIDLSNPEIKDSGFLGVDTLFFDEEGKRLIFTAGTAQGDITHESWGCIDLDGTGFENHIFEKNAGMAAAYKNGKLLLGEDSLTFEKRMAYVDIAAGEEKYGTNIESENAGGGFTIGGPSFSDKGESFAVTDIGGSNQAVLTIYNTADFSKIYQEVIRDENEELFYGSPRVYLFDGLRVCIVCMRGDKEVPSKALLIRY